MTGLSATGCRLAALALACHQSEATSTHIEEQPVKKKLALSAVLICLMSSAFAANNKQVSYKSGDDTVQGILYTPASGGSAKLPAIVVIHEYWGLNDWVKQQAERLADQGYAALAVDLYRGKVASTPDEAHELMRGVPPDRATRDLLAAANFLRSQPNVDPNRVGSIGWCMGGGYSLDLALNDPKLAAAVINYGHLATDPASIAKIHAPILGNFGGLDQGIPPTDVHKFETELKQAGKQADIKIYDDAGHAFENPNNKAGYKPEDAKDATRRTDQFFASNLKR
jgi:carboxymethylenebutenolidase